MKADKELLDWVERKKVRCGKDVKIFRVYRVTTIVTTCRAIIVVRGEMFTRRLAKVHGVWKEFEHGKSAR